MEQYADVPNVRHSVCSDKEANQQNGGNLLKDKRLSGNKLFDLIPRMKKTKKAPDISTSQQNYEKLPDISNVDKDTKFDVKLRVNPPRIGPYKRDDIQSVLGIIPQKSLAANDRNERGYTLDYGRDSKIIIAGFTPTGPAIKSHQLEIGE